MPPQCLFPESKDIKEFYQQSFRLNLIKVPSCKEHNLKRSKDDEYLMACLAARVGNNGVSLIHTNTKLKRSFQWQPKLLHVEKQTSIEISGNVFPTSIVNVDVNRLSHSFESIARALYYYENRKIFIGDCIMISDIFLHPDMGASDSNLFNLKAIELISRRAGTLEYLNLW
ncbi:MAG: hypothetical protein JWM44_3649 [Bacilli bacterium]|nr:hypothetical protein [Bacilli bacterium]